MELVLLRHGKPLIDTKHRVTSSGFGKWIADYDATGLDLNHPPPPETLHHPWEHHFVVCSTLKRSIDSASVLKLKGIHVIDHCFRELEMPYADIRSPRLSPMIWSTIYRLAWLAGFSANAEPFHAAKVRTIKCVTHLTRYVRQHEKVVFVGHGGLLWLIANQLLALGWQGPKRAPRAHWAFAVYRYPLAD